MIRTFMQSVFVAAALAVSAGAIAQNPQDPPPPEELEPAVDTSAQSQSSDADMTSAPAVPQPAAPESTPPPAAPQPAAGASTQPAPAPAPSRSGARVMDRLELEATQITGNRELPKVLYIVPWKRSDLGDLVGRPVNSLLDEVLAPVDRDVFKRENRYYTALRPGEAGAAGTSGAPASESQAPPADAPPARDER